MDAEDRLANLQQSTDWLEASNGLDHAQAAHESKIQQISTNCLFYAYEIVIPTKIGAHRIRASRLLADAPTTNYLGHEWRPLHDSKRFYHP